QVTFRGAPLPAGVVVFTPDGDYGGHGPCATGTIGPDGRYTLATDGTPGAAPGKHRAPAAGPAGWRLPATLLNPQLPGLRAEAAAAGERRVAVTGPAGWRLPDTLLAPQLSGLRAEVVAGRENVRDFKLEVR